MCALLLHINHTTNATINTTDNNTDNMVELNSDNKSDNYMAKPFFSGRIPQSLADKVDAYLANTGETRSELLLRLLRAEVGDDNADNKTDILTDLIQRVTKLEQIIADNKAVITTEPKPKKPRTTKPKVIQTSD
jgi:hypothetical protein